MTIRGLMSHTAQRVAFGHRMFQAFSSNVREASMSPPIQQHMRSAVQCIGTTLCCAKLPNKTCSTEGGRMSPTNMVTVARNKCCLGQILLTSLGLTSGNAATRWRGRSVNFYNHSKHDRSQRSTTSFNAYFAGPGWK